MTERRWSRGLFLIEVDDGQGFRPATAAEVDSALRQRHLFGAADYPDRDLPLPAGPGEQRVRTLVVHEAEATMTAGLASTDAKTNRCR